MRYTRSIMAACSLWVAGAALLAVAQAQGPADEKTYFTFKTAVELPGGVTLQPGKYAFKLADSLSNRHIVQVYNEEQSQIFATILAVPASRTEPAEDAFVTFAESSPNEPQPIRFWFYPGDKTGHEFVYPKEQALRIAKATNQKVLAVDTTSSDADAMKSAKITTVDPSGQEVAYSDPAQVAQPGSQSTAETRAEPAQPRAPAAQPTTTAPAQPSVSQPSREDPDDELPDTATVLPLIALIGFVALGGWATLRAITR